MIPRCSRLTLFSICCAITILGIGAASPRADDPPAPVQTLTVTRTVVSMYRGHTARYYAKWGKHRTRQLQHALGAQQRLYKALVAKPSVQEALALACVAYRTSCSRVYWIAYCESTLNSGAENPEPTSDASGLGQFLSGTWASTPYGRFSVFSPYANALAIAYEVAAGNSHVHWQASESCWGRH